MFFWALSVTITIPYIGVLLMVAMNIVLFGSAIINSIWSFIQFLKVGEWAFENSFWNWIGICLTITGTILNIFFIYKPYRNDLGIKTFLKDWKKWLIQPDILILLFFFITGILSLSRSESSKLEMNRSLSSFVVAIVLFMGFNKNKDILNKNKKIQGAESNLAAGTGMLTDLLSKLYKVLFTRSSVEVPEEEIGDEKSTSASIYWVVLYSFLNYFISDNVVTEYNPSLFRSILIILVIIKRACLQE